MSNFGVVVFFDDQTTNATSDPYLVKDGGYRLLKATGVFGGATITIECDFDDEQWAPIQAYQFTESDIKSARPLRPGLRMRAVLTGASGTTNVSLSLLS